MAMALAFFNTWEMYSLNMGDCAWTHRHTIIEMVDQVKVDFFVRVKRVIYENLLSPVAPKHLSVKILYLCKFESPVISFLLGISRIDQ